MIDSKLIAKIKERLAVEANYQFFFEHLNKPEWINPLLAAGFFKTPPGRVLLEDGGVGFPFWPESQYLLRMAEIAPSDVLAAIKAMGDTDNQRVMEDVVQILIKLDADKAAGFTDKVVGYLKSPYQLRLQDFAAELTVKLANSRHMAAALKIAAALLDVQPDPRAAELEGEELRAAFLEPKVNYHDYEYQQIIEKITLPLAEADPVKTVELYRDLLTKAVQYKLFAFAAGEMDEDEDAYEDYSTIWRPDIAGTHRNWEGDARHSLVSALKDSLSTALASDLDNEKKLALLESICAKKYKVLKRVVEYTLREYKDNEVFKSLYDKLYDELQPITDPAILSRGRFEEFTPSAGMSIEDLTSLSDDEFIEKLKTYQPSEFRFEREAMGTLVEQAIKADPDRFIKLADRFFDTNYLYVNSLFSASAEKVDDLDESQLVTIMQAGQRLIAAALPEDNTELQFVDWAKMALTRFLYKVVAQRPDKTEYLTEKSIGIALKLTLSLCRDPDPTPEYEKRYGGDNMDAATLSINTTRGEGLHALVRMILWVNRNKPKGNILAKIYEELSWHLDVKNDPSSTARAVYGQWLPWIWDSNKGWAEANLEKIFTQDDRGDGAWDAYITMNQVFNDLFPLIEPIINQRLGDLADYNKDEKSRRDDRTKLAQHLMVFYWRGLIDLSEGSLTRRFFDTAHVHYRSEALHFIGFELRNVETLSSQITERLVALWEYRLSTLKGDPSLDVEELEQFGSWFASSVFDEEWTLSTLQASLELAHNADPDFLVLEKLSKLSEKYPLQTMLCLKDMIAGARERWAIDSWRDNALAIIKAAYHSEDTTAKQLAVDVTNHLVARGYHIFRDAIATD